MRIPSLLSLSIPFADFPLQLSSLPFSLENSASSVYTPA